jgi:mannose-1-phosphate guanylyltransferase
MKAILLAAGLGTRLRPVTDTIPKCLIPIQGRPLLDYWLQLLFEQGIEEVLINTHYLPEQIHDYVSKNKWTDKITLVHEEKLYGTGGTILNNSSFFDDEPILVAHADNLTIFNVQDFAQKFNTRPTDVDITMMTFMTDTPTTCGIVELDQNSIVQKFHEKVDNPPGNMANAAIYIFSPEVIHFMRSLNQSTIDISTEIIPKFLGRMNTFQNNLYLRDIGSIKSLTAAENEISIVSNFLNG